MTKSINKPTQLHSHLLFSIAQSTKKNQKRVHSNALTKKRKLNEMLSIKELAAYNIHPGKKKHSAKKPLF